MPRKIFLILPLLVLLCVASLSIACWGETCGAQVVGDWECGYIPITVFADNVASFAGAKTTWSGISSESIRIEVEEQGETGLAQLSITQDDDSGDKKATLKIGPLEESCVAKD